MKQEYCQFCMNDLYQDLSIFEFLKQDQLLCNSCRQQLKRIDRSVVWDGLKIHMLYEYNDFFESMIFQFKEGHDIALQDVFFYDDMKKINDRFRHYTIVLMPSSPEKSEERGFLPMRAMLKNTKLPIVEPFYKSENRKQSLQSLENRHRIQEVIRRRSDVKLPSTKLLLMDDVCTSGSTLICAYHLLREHTYKIEAVMLSVHPLFVELCDEKGLKMKKIFSIL